MVTRKRAVAVVLVILVLIVFGQVVRHGFTPYDDDVYVYENQMVARGLSATGAVWAFTSVGYAGNWHPLTWLSHMADVSVFGLSPGGHHFTSILIHAMTGVLVFFLFVDLTGALWKSAMAAALFLVHPLHVESVVWISERKDVLAALFTILTIMAWLRHVTRRDLTSYLGAVVLFTLALLSKPMAITLPLLLVILDWWPLGRMTGGPPPARGRSRPLPGWKNLIIEKASFAALSAAAAILTWVAQGRGGAISTFVNFPIGQRLANALDSTLVYIAKTAWPSGLAVFYPHPGPGLAPWRPLLAAGILAGVTAAAVVLRRSRPWLIAGWAWYGVMLLPVLGVIQVGSQARADRYTYLPLTGIFIIALWGIDDLTVRWKGRGRVLATAALIAVSSCTAAAFAQTRNWRDGETLFNHALAVTQRNWIALSNLGKIREERGDVPGAVALYAETVAVLPGDPKAHYNLAVALVRLGRAAEAIEAYRTAVILAPGWVEARYNLGVALFYAGRLAESTAAYREALRQRPEYPDALFNLGNNLFFEGRKHEAAEAYRKALTLRPDSIEVRENLERLTRGGAGTADDPH